MKKISNVMLMVVLMFTVCTFAQAADSVVINPANLEGDTLYLPESGTFAVGVGTNLATIEDVVEVRGMIVSTVDNESVNKVGVGIGINLPKVIAKLGGTWLIDNVNSSIGITALTNLDGKARVEPAIYLTVVSMSY